MSEENRKVIHRLLDEVWNKGDLEVAHELIDTNLIDNVTKPGAQVGVEGFKRAVTTFRSAFPDLSLAINDELAEGDKVAITWTARGTHRGDLMGIAPTGKSVEIRGAYVYRISGGKVVERSGARDMFSLMQQLGVIPS